MEQQEFEQRLATLAAADTTKRLREATADLLMALGYRRWIYASDNPYGTLRLPATLANDYGMWMLTYMTKGYMKVDPILEHCRSSTEPLLWDSREGWDETPEKVQAMMRDAAENGFGSGVAIPLRLPDQPQGVINVTSPVPLADSQAHFEAMLPCLRQVGMTLHAGMINILKESARYEENLVNS